MSWKVSCSISVIRIHFTNTETLEGLCCINIWEKTISGRGDSQFKCFDQKLNWGFEEEQSGQCVWNRENQKEIIREGVSEVPKSRSCTALLAIVRVLLSITGSHGRVWSGETM